MISGMDTTDEQFVSITDPTTNQEIMVPVSQANLGPFESLLAATEAADHSEENTGEGKAFYSLETLCTLGLVQLISQQCCLRNFQSPHIQNLRIFSFTSKSGQTILKPNTRKVCMELHISHAKFSWFSKDR